MPGVRRRVRATLRVRAPGHTLVHTADPGQSVGGGGGVPQHSCVCVRVCVCVSSHAPPDRAAWQELYSLYRGGAHELLDQPLAVLVVTTTAHTDVAEELRALARNATGVLDTSLEFACVRWWWRNAFAAVLCCAVLCCAML